MTTAHPDPILAQLELDVLYAKAHRDEITAAFDRTPPWARARYEKQLDDARHDHAIAVCRLNEYQLTGNHYVR